MIFRDIWAILENVVISPTGYDLSHMFPRNISRMLFMELTLPQRLIAIVWILFTKVSKRSPVVISFMVAPIELAKIFLQTYIYFFLCCSRDKWLREKFHDDIKILPLPNSFGREIDIPSFISPLS